VRGIDANIFLRYLTGDDPGKARATFELFQRIQRGDGEVTTTVVHLHETVYVLASPRLYHLGHSDIRDRLLPLLALRGLKIADKRRCMRALNLFADYPFLDFADALLTASLHDAGVGELYSYDTDFDRLPAIRRLEP